ncbi:MAG: glycosyltransferase [Planctomycetes bacterium]|nr:glycosyltransferase [Planctomycetota bacterium]MBI3835925.1 glycosyltransferase [Planctomycetota bacterium]
MISDRLIICIGSEWDYDPTSKHHVMRCLSRTNNVLWVNYHGTRKPSFNEHDWHGAVQTLKRVTHGVQRISDSMAQFTPIVIPGAKSCLARKIHEALLIAQIRRAVRNLGAAGKRTTQVWTFAPDTPFLKGRLNEECFVYYCTDDHRRFAGFDADRIAAQENELIDRADVMVACSEPLYKAHSIRRNDILLLRHGVDFEHFAAAWKTQLPIPYEMANIARPVVGFFGLIHHWIDVELIARVAAMRPNFSFLLLGDCKVDVSHLQRLPNVHLLGRRDYSVLPAYCARFDAAMLPFTQSAMTISINPVKMYEYLAAGLPVVSTPLPESKRFPEAIHIAETPVAFATACDAAVAIGRSDAKQISSRVQNDTWSTRVEQLSEYVQRRLNTIPIGTLPTCDPFAHSHCHRPPLAISSPA